jgi:hypothetical protein
MACSTYVRQTKVEPETMGRGLKHGTSGNSSIEAINIVRDFRGLKHMDSYSLKNMSSPAKHMTSGKLKYLGTQPDISGNNRIWDVQMKPLGEKGFHGD